MQVDCHLVTTQLDQPACYIPQMLQYSDKCWIPRLWLFHQLTPMQGGLVTKQSRELHQYVLLGNQYSYCQMFTFDKYLGQNILICGPHIRLFKFQSIICSVPERSRSGFSDRSVGCLYLSWSRSPCNLSLGALCSCLDCLFGGGKGLAKNRWKIVNWILYIRLLKEPFHPGSECSFTAHHLCNLATYRARPFSVTEEIQRMYPRLWKGTSAENVV